MNQNMDTNLANLPETPESAPKGIPIDKILELRRKDLSHGQIAELLGCSRSNVTQRLKDHQEDLDGLDRFKKHRADIFAYKQMQMVQSLTADKLQKAPLNVLMPALGILYDKERLERGQSTNNVSVRGSLEKLATSATELEEEKARLMAEMDEMEGDD